MTEITIEYCVPCGLLNSAIDTERALLEEFGRDIDEVRLQPGHGGVFKIHADGETIFDKDENGAELALPEIKDAVRDRNQTPAQHRNRPRSGNQAMLELYQAEDCPYSETVRETLTELGVSYITHNPRRHGGEVRNEQTHAELIELGGEDQISFLVDQQRGEMLYESADTVEYLEEHYS